MDDPDVQKCDRVAFKHVYSSRNSQLKEHVQKTSIHDVKMVLMTVPFCYPESISREVAEGIIIHGDKLCCNATAESDDDDNYYGDHDDDGFLDDINQAGDDFNGLTESTALEIQVTENINEECSKTVRRNFPLPLSETLINQAKAPNFAQALRSIKEYIKTEGRFGFSATIVLLGDLTEDGVVFGGNQIVPSNIIEKQLKKILDEEDDPKIAPRAIDLVTTDGDIIYVSTIKADSNEVNKYVLYA